MKKSDIYASVTDRIIKAIEKGTGKCGAQWLTRGNSELPLRHNGQSYRGLNVILLWLESLERGFQSNRWMTYNQAQALGGQVRAEEKGTAIVFFKMTAMRDKGNGCDSTETDVATADADKVVSIPFARSHTVFNVDQIDGLPQTYYAQAPLPPLGFDAAEAFFTATGARVVHGGNKACFVPSVDVIKMPLPQDFVSAEAYLAVKAHELRLR